MKTYELTVRDVIVCKYTIEAENEEEAEEKVFLGEEKFQQEINDYFEITDIKEVKNG